MIREQLVRTQERAARSWMDVPPAFLRQVNEIAKQDFFSTDGLTLAQVRHETDATLRQFSLSYCYLLLHNSRCAHAPARERHSFEAMYAIAIDTATSVLAAHSLDRVIDHELRRLFRSALFATDARPDVVDPVQAQFIAALAQRRGAAAAAAAPSACGSGAGASCPPGFAPLAALAGSLGALSPEPRAASAASRAASASRRSTGRTKEPRMGGIGQWGTAIGRAPPPLSPPPTLAASQRGVRPASGSVSASAPRLPAASRATSASTRPASSARSSRPGDAMQADAAPRPGSAAAAAAQARHKKISINAVRMLRSPLANETLPPVQRFLFVQSRPEAISSVVG
nr:hypothetical protein HK105_003727 [Polyrhizophydium stewartii]